MHSDDGNQLPVSAAGSSGGLTADEALPGLWHQVEAFRELLQDGERLLGQVLDFTRCAEQSLAALEREKAEADLELARLRREREESIHDYDTVCAALREREARLQGLEGELSRLRVEEEAPPVPAGIAQRLQRAERELEETRLILAGERLRRNRAISLIRPSAGSGGGEGA